MEKVNLYKGYISESFGDVQMEEKSAKTEQTISIKTSILYIIHVLYTTTRADHRTRDPSLKKKKKKKKKKKAVNLAELPVLHHSP